ncbi:hypothetical protein BKA70DRAFT_1448755 [Coprinopsis sp. MPI-PUGE-AT-0042]|nr:hypothetical protein BKA70DRAFT_1448755 [Coprinopsis sp. MPI-PUGE-AT-0042]
MPVVTRAQSLRQADLSEETCTGNPAKKHVRRSRATSARGRVQSRLTRTTWETRLENFRTDAVFLSGETFARTVDPFVNMRKLLEDELKVERDLVATSQTWRHMIHPSHRIDQRRYIALKSLLSPEGDLSLCTAAVRKHIVTLLSKGQSSAWSCDARAAQELIHRGLQVDCGEDARAQLVQAGHLLRSIDRPLEGNPIAFQTALQSLSAGSWPAILYQNMELNPNQPEEGFLMNRLLVAVYKAIHRSSPGQRLPLTAPSIIYIATLVASAVAAPETYPHRKLFRLLSEYLDHNRQAVWFRDLLRWWGRQLEGPPTTNFKLMGRTDTTRPGLGMLDRLKEGSTAHETIVLLLSPLTSIFVLRARVASASIPNHIVRRTTWHYAKSICLPSLGFEHLALPSIVRRRRPCGRRQSLPQATPATNTDSVPEQALLQIDAGPVSGSFVTLFLSASWSHQQLIVTISLYVLSLCSAPSAGGLFLKRAKLVERYEIKIPRYVKAWQMGTTFSKVTQPLAF